MVYCTRCGTLNADDAIACKNCGAPLQTAQAQSIPPQAESRPYNRHWRWEERHEYHRRSGAFAALAIGLIIVLIGFSALLAEFYNINIPWGAIILVFIGVLIIVAGIRARNRWNKRQ
jgi:uncharacterized membrane protein YvbJ